MDSAAAKEQYAEAKRLFRAGRHTEALTLLQDLRAAMPHAKHVLLAQAECLVALGDLDAARSVCWQILAQEDDDRARRILARCEVSPPPLPSPLATTGEPRAAVETREIPLPNSPKSYRRLLIAITAVIVVVGAIAFAAERNKASTYQRGIRHAATPAGRAVDPMHAETPAESADPVADYAKMLEERKAERDAATHEAEAKRIADAEAASKRPGYEISQEQWNLDPDTGVPAWRPGIYHRLPCKDSWFEHEQAPRTIDVYIPMAYTQRPDELLPVLTISKPELNPGFRGYEPWAERRGVILITLNSSYNDGGVANNREAQLAAYNFLNGHLRAHPNLNFATGVSGGAQMSWIMAANSPDMFAGVLMCAHGGFRDVPLAPHIRVAYVNGQDDWNAPYIVEIMARLRASGNEVRHQVVPGGHVEGPLNLRTQMLDWLLDSARRDLEAASPEPAEN